jgi:hypothetical protein
MAGVLTPGGYVSKNQFFSEHAKPICSSLQLTYLATQILGGFWNTTNWWPPGAIASRVPFTKADRIQPQHCKQDSTVPRAASTGINQKKGRAKNVLVFRPAISKVLSKPSF